MNIYQMRRRSNFEEIDYLKVSSLLRDYNVPRAKITNLLRNKDLIRVKKGLYIFGDEIRQGPYCKEHLANLIYGPSAISLESALSYYSMIPERVEETTSITIRRNKRFETPAGVFSYRYITHSKYSVGITQANIGGRTILIATPEKAICDILYLNDPRVKDLVAMESHLFENLRLEPDCIKNLNLSIVQQFSKIYHNLSIDLFLDLMNSVQGK